MLLINCYVGQKVQSLVKHWWSQSLPCFQTSDLNFTATFTSEGWFCIIREIALHLCYGLPCNAKRRCKMYMYISVHVSIYIWVITCWTPQPNNIQPRSWREGRALIHRFPLSLGTDLMHAIFGNLSILKRRGEKDIGTSQVSGGFLFQEINIQNSTGSKPKKLINNFDQKQDRSGSLFPLLLFWKQNVWSIEENKHHMWCCSDTDVKTGWNVVF